MMMAEESVLERAARALCDLDGLDPDAQHQPMSGEVILDVAAEQPAWKQYKHKARAVLQAIREPSEEMMSAGLRHIPEGAEYTLLCDAEAVWSAMIDTALSEGTESAD